MKGTCSLHYRHRSKGGILIISLNPSRGDHAAGNLWNGLSTWRSEIGNCVIDVIKATMAQLLWVGLTYINYNTFHSTIVLWRDVFAWHHLVARLGALPGTTLLRSTAMTIVLHSVCALIMFILNTDWLTVSKAALLYHPFENRPQAIRQTRRLDSLIARYFVPHLPFSLP